MRVLLIKMSSLGDVVHTLPAVTEAARHGITFDWVVEEGFAAIPPAHPAVNLTIPIAWRRWRRNLFDSRGELAGFFTRLREHHYDVVLDAQGLLKSAAVGLLANGSSRSGFSRDSAREGAASTFYSNRIPVARGQHAIDRLRQLFAAAFAYELDPSPAEFGIDAPSLDTSEKRCVLLHGTTWPSKHWPQEMWVALAGMLTSAGFKVQIPWGNDAELNRAREVSTGNGDRVEVLDELSLADLIPVLAGASLAVGVDSGLAHLSAALGVPTVVIYGSTDSQLTGCRGTHVTNLRANFSCAPCLQKECSYTGPAQTWQGGNVVPACYFMLPPARVMQEIETLLARSAQ